jgi:hypothetical protein
LREELSLSPLHSEIADPGVPLELEVHTKHQVGADKMIGQAKVPLPVDSQDEVVDCWVDLELPAKMKEKNKVCISIIVEIFWMPDIDHRGFVVG